MKIAMVSEHASPLAALGGEDAGGQNVHVDALARHLAQRGAEVVVHTRRDDPGLPRRVPLADGVWVDHIDAGPPRPVPKDDLPRWMGDFTADLSRQWDLDPPDIAHAHFWMSGQAAVAAARCAGVPTAVTFHALGVVKRRYQGDKDTSPPERVAVEGRLVHDVDHVVATCSDEVFELVRMGGDSARMSIVPCGVDLGLFSPEGPVAPRPRGRHRLLAVGRLVERKGLADIITALPGLPDAELVVAGGPDAERVFEDPLVARLGRLACQLGVADRVRFVGRVGRSDVPPLVRSADVVVCVPWYEPFGIVPLEAMACGVPVVASGVGGLVDSVVHGVTGLHVPPRDPAALRESLTTLLSDPALRGRLGAAGVNRARSRYGWPRVADSTLQVYRALGGGRRRRRNRTVLP